MEVEVISEKENPLLERRDVMVRIKHTGAKTPLRSEIRKLLTAKLSADDDKLILGPLDQSFGVAESLAKVKIYKTQERAVQIESPHLIRKNTTEKAKPAVEKPAEVKEVKAPEPAEEPKVEEKKPEPVEIEKPKVEAEKKEKAPKKAEKKPKTAAETPAKPEPVKEKEPPKPDVKQEAPKKTEKKAKKEPKTEKTAKAKKPKKKAEKSKAKEE
jgi:small subunit ribosomal protein S24e